MIKNEKIDEFIRDVTQVSSIPKSAVRRRLNEIIELTFKECLPPKAEEWDGWDMFFGRHDCCPGDDMAAAFNCCRKMFLKKYKINTKQWVKDKAIAKK